MAQETVADIERTRKELEAAIMRKDAEIGSLASKLDDEQGLVGKVQKSIKELQGRIEEMKVTLSLTPSSVWTWLDVSSPTT